MIKMSEKEYIDFKKEFEEFKNELEKSKPMFDDDSIEFNDFDNLISLSENEDFSNSGNDLSNFYYDSNGSFPNIALETDDILINLVIKKDYSKIEDFDIRKEEFFNDLREFIEEFKSTEESDELMKYYEK